MGTGVQCLLPVVHPLRSFNAPARAAHKHYIWQSAVDTEPCVRCHIYGKL